MSKASELFKDYPIKRIEFNSDLRTFKKGESIDMASRLVVLVGLNGCGKSTILDVLRESCGIKDSSYMKHEMAKHVDVTKREEKFEAKYFDFHSGDRKYSSTFGDDMSSQVASMHASSGIGLLIQFQSTGIKQLRGGLIILDEPERGLATKIQMQMEMMLLELTVLGRNQIIVSSHSEYLMEAGAAFGKLYSVEHKKFFDSKEDYLRAHLGEELYNMKYPKPETTQQSSETTA